MTVTVLLYNSPAATTFEILAARIVDRPHVCVWSRRKLAAPEWQGERLPPPEGLWSTHKLPFNRLTPHLASKACWRVPEDGEGEAGPSEVSPAARSKPAAVKGRAWLNGHSHPEGDHCGGTMPHFLLQNNGGILSGLSQPISVMLREAVWKDERRPEPSET